MTHKITACQLALNEIWGRKRGVQASVTRRSKKRLLRLGGGRWIYFQNVLCFCTVLLMRFPRFANFYPAAKCTSHSRIVSKPKLMNLFFFVNKIYIIAVGISKAIAECCMMRKQENLQPPAVTWHLLCHFFPGQM